MYRITSQMSSMALTLSGKAKRCGKGALPPLVDDQRAHGSASGAR